MIYLCSVLKKRGTKTKFYSSFILNVIMGAINPMNYSLSERKLKIGKQAGKTVRIARARVRGRVSFARFCDLVAEHTTFNYMEVASILNLSADMARGLVAGGETVEYGRLGCLCPSLRSKAVVKEVDFNAATAHIQYMPVTNRSTPSTTPRTMRGPCLGIFAMSSR